MGPGGGHSGGGTTVDGEAVDPLLGAADLGRPTSWSKKTEKTEKTEKKQTSHLLLESFGIFGIY